MVNLQISNLRSNSNFDKLNISNQNSIFGGLKAANSLTPNGNGTYSSFNFTHLESGDRGKVVNQVNATPGTAVALNYKDNGNVLNQVNAADALVALEGV